MTDSTKNATLVVEGLPPVSREEVEQILKELSELVKSVCGGDVKTLVLDETTPEAEI
jgi:DNA/RNA-binding domain of Phe-tRNA-synthetase-like protein